MSKDSARSAMPNPPDGDRRPMRHKMPERLSSDAGLRSLHHCMGTPRTLLLPPPKKKKTFSFSLSLFPAIAVYGLPPPQIVTICLTFRYFSGVF
jgi:hypothetical protein